jgi:hypothetical protein
MSTKLYDGGHFCTQSRPVDKPVEIVEKYEFSTAISEFKK